MIKLNLNPYIVIGVGRCGSSFVSKILHDDYNISMGESFVPANEFNPDGYYECLTLGYLLSQCSLGEITYPKMLKKLSVYIAGRPKRWGFKDRGSLNLIFFNFNEPRIIACERPYWLCLRSLIKKQKVREPKLTKDEVEKYFECRKVMYERMIKYFNPVVIPFRRSVRTTKEEVMEILERKWPDINGELTT